MDIWEKAKWVGNLTRAMDAGNKARDLAYKVKDEWGSMEIELLKYRAGGQGFCVTWLLRCSAICLRFLKNILEI